MKEIVKAEPDGSLPIQWEKDTNLAGLPIPGGKAAWALHIGIFRKKCPCDERSLALEHLNVELAGRPGAFDLNETATDGHPAALEEESHRMAEIARALHARDVRIAQTVEEALRLATARRAAFSSLARIAPMTILEDATVPRSELARMM